MSWLDTMRARHRDPAELRRAVAERLYQAHNITRRDPLPGGFQFLALTEREGWLRRADNLLDRPHDDGRTGDCRGADVWNGDVSPFHGTEI